MLHKLNRAEPTTWDPMREVAEVQVAPWPEEISGDSASRRLGVPPAWGLGP